MKYKEFKKAVEDWGEKYNYGTEVEIEDSHTCIKIEFDGDFHCNTYIINTHRFVMDTDMLLFREISELGRAELFDIIVKLAKTPPEDRRDEKRFIIPLPELITTDGKQQYLTHKDCKFFASRRDEKLRQTWEEEHLKFVPEIYRQFAVEFDEEKEY